MTLRLKAVARNVREVRPGTELPYVALEHVESGTGRFIPGFEPETRLADAEIVFRLGDVLFGKLRPYLAKVIAPDFAGCASGEFMVLRPSTSVDPRFLYYVCLSRPFLDWAEATSVGTKMPRTDWEQLSTFRLYAPRLERQRVIADFLDRETARIDELLHKSHLLVHSLRQRQGVLRANAILGRTDGFAERVPTGDVALPELPRGWRPARLRHVADEITVGVVVTPTAYYVDEGLPFIRGFNVKPGLVTGEALARIGPEGNSLHPKSILRPGDVLVVRTGQAGAAAVVPDWAIGGNCVDVLIIRCGPSLLPRFLEAVVNSEPSARQIEALSVGAIQSHVNVGALRELVIPLPPTDDQERVLAIVDQEDAKLVALVELVERQIGKLTERRQSLITEAVSGELNLGHVA
jgi:type I restriction enzyme S subunit